MLAISCFFEDLDRDRTISGHEGCAGHDSRCSDLASNTLRGFAGLRTNPPPPHRP